MCSEILSVRDYLDDCNLLNLNQKLRSKCSYLWAALMNNSHVAIGGVTLNAHIMM